MILHNKPAINNKEIESLKSVLESGWIAQGKKVREFENLLCRYLGYKPGYAVAFSSGTAALFVTLVSLGIKQSDEIIIPSYVCSAVLNAVYLARANPVLVDVNPEDFNISFEQTKKKISSKTKTIIIPHIYGVPANVDKFVKLSIPVIEDCAQAIGSEYKGKKVGTFGDAAIFSFYASKMLTTGYGGMVFSKNGKIIEKIRDYREFDCRRHYKPRFNFQLSDFQAAMGISQIKRLPQFIEKRTEIADEYYEILPSENVWPSNRINNKRPNFYRFLIKVNNPKKLKRFLESKGIKAIIPIQTFELLHRYLRQNPKNFPVSEEIAKTTLSIPIYPSLKKYEIEKIKFCLKEYFRTN